MYRNDHIVVKNVFLRQELIDTKFACDLLRCKGACCTLDSEYGAPLLDDEISQIQDSIDAVKQYLSEDQIEKIESEGFFENKNRELQLKSINNKECVFAFYDNDIAKCSFEKAFNDGKIEFRKPISCHLFPIRISKFGGDILRYEQFSECKPAIEKGNKEKINLIDFCKDALIRHYGKKWFSILKELIGR